MESGDPDVQSKSPFELRRIAEFTKSIGMVHVVRKELEARLRKDQTDAELYEAFIFALKQQELLDRLGNNESFASANEDADFAVWYYEFSHLIPAELGNEENDRIALARVALSQKGQE